MLPLPALSRPRVVALFFFLLMTCGAFAESPYFVTYDHHLEESGDLETSVFTMVGLPRLGERAYFAPLAEIEYGVRDWWTSSLYLEGQGTLGDSFIWTGWRFENRFRPLRGEHVINPVLYVEYESINEASRIQKEIVGNSSDFSDRNGVLRSEHAHELEGKLILSSDVHNWNISENFVLEKNLSESEGIEFGYAVGVARALAEAGAGCHFCRRNMSAGLELYGGLGSTRGFGLADTTHYLAPAVSWKVSENSTLHFSPAFGLTHGASPVLFRFGYSYEIENFGNKMSLLFHRGN
jgi:hypothetical protein